MDILLLSVLLQQTPVTYSKLGDRVETVQRLLKALDLPSLEGNWHYAGPFDNQSGVGFEKEYAPEKRFELQDKFTGKDGASFGWRSLPQFQPGRIYDLKPLFTKSPNDGVVYLAHEFQSKKAITIPLLLGSDDTLSVFMNGKRVLHEEHSRGVSVDSDRVDVQIQVGKNLLLIKIGQFAGEWGFAARFDLPRNTDPALLKALDSDFPLQSSASAVHAAPKTNEHYQVFTFEPPANCLLEVGGLALRPDGSLLVCTRRGEIWRITNPSASSSESMQHSRFASGLHEPLGMHVVDNATVYVAQRPELSRITDSNNDGKADQFDTVCDRWGVSGDYHEYCFGPAVDRQGYMYLTLNVGFGGGHQAKAAWRGWCVRVDPKTGQMEPWAYGLRSPNGITVSPDGDLFYADNQGEWVATNKLHHIQRGQFFGHQASLIWLKDSPFAKLGKSEVRSGMHYDGTNPRDPSGSKTYPELSPPAIWFPFTRMGQSVSEPIWDTTQGRFGPFAGQCFVGDQNRATVMRVALEKVNGVFQGACFPFIAGLQCGVNRLCFGKDGSLFVGQTARGWGGVGGKPYGLQRIQYTGKLPFEMHHIELIPNGFKVHFTKPIDPMQVSKECASVKSWTYVYKSDYGCPETDTLAENVSEVTVSPDQKSLTVKVDRLQQGRVYELQIDDVIKSEGQNVLHNVGYYTINELVKAK